MINGDRTSQEKLLAEQQGRQVYLNMALSIFKRKWWLILIVLLLAEAFTFYFAKIPEGPYMATAVIRPVFTRSSGITIPYGGAVGGGGAGTFNVVETEFEIIRGKKVAERVIEKLGLTELYSKPEDNGRRRKGTAPEPRDLPPDIKRRMLLTGLQSRLDVSWRQNNKGRSINLVGITARSYSPDEAMNIANATGEAYIEVYDNYKRLAWQELINLTETELNKAKQALDESRNQLYSSASEKQLSSVFSPILGGSAMPTSDLPVGITTLRNRIMELEIKLNTMKRDYPELNPQVSGVKKEIEETKQRLEQEEAKAKVKFGEQYGLSNLAAQVMFNQELYNTLVASHQQLLAQFIMEKQSPEIVERAERPLLPSELSRRSGLSVAAVVGFALGVVLSLLLEYLDTSMRTVGEVAQRINIPVIGKIPCLKDIKNRPGSDALITYKATNPSRRTWIRNFYKESYRALQFESLAALSPGINNFNQNNTLPVRSDSQSTNTPLGIALMVTSSVPEEGKSIVAANLAVSIAQTGRKVLLVDSDCRHPSQHLLLGIDPNSTPKLVDVLTQKAKPQEAFRESSIDNLYVITSGNEDGQIDASGILSSPGMQEFINLLREEFDIIIFDSPAASLASESAAIGSMVDGVIMVVKVASTRKGDVLQAKEIIQYSGGNIIGIALNFAAAEKKDRKYY